MFVASDHGRDTHDPAMELAESGRGCRGELIR